MRRYLYHEGAKKEIVSSKLNKWFSPTLELS